MDFIQDAVDLDKAVERLKERASYLRRAEQLSAYLDDIEGLQIAVALPSIVRREMGTSAYGCTRTHHDALPEPAQRILRKHMSGALNAAILELTAKAKGPSP